MEQLKSENSRKWRLQERDDWKSLVDSVQADRARLQEETMRLNLQLEDAQAEIERQAELLAIAHTADAGSRPSSPEKISRVTSQESEDEKNTSTENHVEEHIQSRDSLLVETEFVNCQSGDRFEGTPQSRSELIDSPSRPFSPSRNAGSPSATSPRAYARRFQMLQLELEKVNNQARHIDYV